MEETGKKVTGKVVTGQPVAGPSTGGTVKQEAKTDQSGAGSTTIQPTATVLRHDFKIIGTIGDTSNCVSYVSILRQLDVGKKKGHKEDEMIDAIIRAVNPACRLKGYLEGRSEIGISELKQILRSFYNERTSTELYQDLCKLTQGGGETIQDFLYRGLELRQKIIFVSMDNPVSYSHELVEKQFVQAMSTGLRIDSIRSEVKTLLQNYSSEEELIQGFQEINKQYQEVRNKFSEPVKAKSITIED